MQRTAGSGVARWTAVLRALGLVRLRATPTSGAQRATTAKQRGALLALLFVAIAATAQPKDVPRIGWVFAALRKTPLTCSKPSARVCLTRGYMRVAA